MVWICCGLLYSWFHRAIQFVLLRVFRAIRGFVRVLTKETIHELHETYEITRTRPRHYELFKVRP